MVKILLVDDEVWIRTSLKNKIEWNEELTLLAEASDGYEALKLAVNLRPDIVITDVRMPGMSGLEMLSKMREFLPDLEAVFISGYNEFDYVKSAIELDASGYVLKPIRKKELNDTLSRTLNKIKKNNLLRKTSATQLALFHKLLEAFYNQAPVDQQVFFSLLTDLHFHSEHMYVLLIRLLENDEVSLSIEQELTAATAALSHPYVYTVFTADRNIYGIFLSSTEKIPLVSYARDLIRRFSRKLSLDASVALGTPAHAIEELPSTFSSARNGLKLMHLYSCHEIILPDTETSNEPFVSLPKEIQRDILDGIYAHNQKDVSLALQNLRNFLARQEHLTIQEVSRVLQLLLGNILQLLYDKDTARNIADKGISLMQTLSSIQPDADLLEKFCSYCMEATVSAEKNTSIEETIRKAEDYLAEHFKEDLSLKKMASLFYLNASYFSVSFKNITGKNFNEYLTELRIREAKKLLSKSTLKVNQISRLVGYEDCSYFGKIFRKATGMTPAEYQRQFLS